MQLWQSKEIKSSLTNIHSRTTGEAPAEGQTVSVMAEIVEQPAKGSVQQYIWEGPSIWVHRTWAIGQLGEDGDGQEPLPRGKGSQTKREGGLKAYQGLVGRMLDITNDKGEYELWQYSQYDVGYFRME